MFNNNVSIVVGSSTKSYGLTSILSGASVRQNAAMPLATPEVLRISHESKGSGASEVKRHMVRIDATKQLVAADGSISTATASAYIVLVVPTHVVTADDIKDACQRVTAFLAATESGATSSNLDRILANEP